jgi:hypothetical protein
LVVVKEAAVCATDGIKSTIKQLETAVYYTCISVNQSHDLMFCLLIYNVQHTWTNISAP